MRRALLHLFRGIALSCLLPVSACNTRTAEPPQQPQLSHEGTGNGGESPSSSAASASLEKPTMTITLSRIGGAMPDYPETGSGQSGSVLLQFTVFADGTTGDFEVVKSDPAGVFDSAAIAAVRQWRYRPFQGAAQVPTRIRLNFSP
jgi:TonB family protein